MKLIKNFIQRYKNAKLCVEQIKNGEWKFAREYPGAEEYRIVKDTLHIWICNGPFFLEVCNGDIKDLDYFGYFWRHYVWWFGVKKYLLNKEAPILE